MAGTALNRTNPFVPLLIPVSAFATGIGLATILSLGNAISPNIIIYSAGVLMMITAIIWAYGSRKSKPSVKFRRRRLNDWLIGLMFLSGGAFIAALNSPLLIPEEMLRQIHHASGWVRSKSTTTGGDVLEVEVHQLSLRDGRKIPTKNLKITLRTDATEAGIDDLIVFPGPLLLNADAANSFNQGWEKRKRLAGEV